MITIPLDEHLSAAENAKKYFDRYTKLKRTEEALNELLEETRSDLEHLESIRTSLDIALDEDDLVEVREELMEYGYLRRKGSSGKKKKLSHARSTTALPTGLTFMWERIIFRTTSFPLNLRPGTTGGSMRRDSRAAM